MLLGLLPHIWLFADRFQDLCRITGLTYDLAPTFDIQMPTMRRAGERHLSCPDSHDHGAL